MPFIWTSTKNATDRASENAFIEDNKGLISRIEKAAALDGVKTSELSVMELMKAPLAVSLEGEFFEKLAFLCKLTEDCKDPKMAHVVIEYETPYLYLTAITETRKITLRFEGDLKPGKEPVESFRLAVHYNEMLGTAKFVDKAFGCTGVELVPHSVAANGDTSTVFLQVTSVEPDQDLVSTEKHDPLKVSVIRLNRSVAECPFTRVEVPKYKTHLATKIKPASRWIFHRKPKYLEFVAPKGMLSFKFEDGAGNINVGETGAPVFVETPDGSLDDDVMENLVQFPNVGKYGLKSDQTLNSVNAEHLAAIMPQLKSDITLHFGIRDDNPIILETDNLQAAIMPSYPQELSGKEVHITKSGGSIVETTPESALKNAVKQNRTSEMIKGSEVDIEISSPKKRTQEQIAVLAHKVEQAVEESQQPEAATEDVTLETPPGERQVIAEEAPEGEDVVTHEPDPIIRVPYAVYNSLVDTMNTIAILHTELGRKLNTAFMQLAAIRGTTLETPSLPGVEEESPTVPRIDEAPRTCDLDEVIQVLSRYVGQTVHCNVLAEMCVGVHKPTLHMHLTKMMQCGVLGKERRAHYTVPEDFAERAATYRASVKTRKRKAR